MISKIAQRAAARYSSRVAADEKIMGYTIDKIRSEVVRGLEIQKGQEEWLTSGNDIIIRFDSASGKILAILSEADPDGNVSEITVPFDLTPSPVMKQSM